MECRWALEILDSARPDSADWQEVELEAAAAHVDSCPSCEEAFRARQALDRRIGGVMRDVPVPNDLLQRLTASLSETHAGLGAEPAAGNPECVARAAGQTENVADHSVVTPASAPQSSKPVSRRHWVRTVAVSLTACALVAGAWFFLTPSAPTLTTDKIGEMAPLQLAGVEVFDNNFAAAAPRGWEDNEALQLVLPYKGSGQNRHGHHQLALIEVRFAGWDGSPQTAILAVVPRQDVDCSDLGTDFASGRRGYAPGSGYNTVSWVSGDFVYVCFIPVGEVARPSLERILRPIAA